MRETSTLVKLLARSALIFISGILATKYNVEVDPSTIDAVASGIAGAAAVGHSIYDKRKR